MTRNAHGVGALIVRHHDDEVGTLRSRSRFLLGERPEGPERSRTSENSESRAAIEKHDAILVEISPSAPAEVFASDADRSIDGDFQPEGTRTNWI
jgi:hypothetical protein